MGYTGIQDTLYRQAVDVLEREGHTVTNDRTNAEICCFFRRSSDGKSKEDTMLMFSLDDEDSDLVAGDIISYDNKKFILLNKETSENDVYKKYAVRQINYNIRVLMQKLNDSTRADLFVIPCVVGSISDAWSAGVLSMLSSTAHVFCTDNAITRRLMVNNRFYFGSANAGCWKIRDIVFVGGFCEIDVQRDGISSNDNADDELADYYKYNKKPNYSIKILNEEEILYTDTETQLIIEVKDDDEIIIPNNIIFSTSDEIIALVNYLGVIYTTWNTGNVVISASFGGQTASKRFTVLEQKQYEYYVLPLYNNGDNYRILQVDTVTFTPVKIENGVTTPTTWKFENISTIPNPNNYYTFTSTANDFKVYNKMVYSNDTVNVRITDMFNGEFFVYSAQLGGMW